MSMDDDFSEWVAMVGELLAYPQQVSLVLPIKRNVWTHPGMTKEIIAHFAGERGPLQKLQMVERKISGSELLEPSYIPRPAARLQRQLHMT